mmetsp:Transcript_4009/g.8487  ORF Transcript_4009/g.8487 Transcript_4009/m.8487 type:complete len:297 (-) Transcript_4009:106-996(-)
MLSGAVVPTGNYAHNANSQPSANRGRVLLYLTTHFSQQHEMYLKYCWRNILTRSPLLQEADVAVLLNPNDAEKRKEAMDVLKETFEDHNLVVYLRSYEDLVLLEMAGTDYSKLNARQKAREHDLEMKNTGALMAIYEPVRSQFFDGYDWVIRLNPDVIIRDDSFLRESMTDPSVSALLINCKFFVKNPLVHTDFTMIRPEFLREEYFPDRVIGAAEQTFTQAIRRTVLDEKTMRWIPNTTPKSQRVCRAGEGSDYFESPIVHEHALHPDICSVPEADSTLVRSAFGPHWPKSWAPV